MFFIFIFIHGILSSPLFNLIKFYFKLRFPALYYVYWSIMYEYLIYSRYSYSIISTVYLLLPFWFHDGFHLVSNLRVQTCNLRTLLLCNMYYTLLLCFSFQVPMYSTYFVYIRLVPRVLTLAYFTYCGLKIF